MAGAKSVLVTGGAGSVGSHLARAYRLDKGLSVVIGCVFNTVGPRQTR